MGIVANTLFPVSDNVPSLIDSQRKASKTEDIKKISADQIRNLEQEIEIVKSGLLKMKCDLTAICIRKRNSYVSLRMKEDFSLGLRELEEELRDEGDEAADFVQQPDSSILRDGIETFCVWSKAYQKLCGRFYLEDMPTGFNNAEDTSMPQLISHCKEFTLNSRERLADIFLTDLGRLRVRMRGWSDNTTPDHEISNWQKVMMEGYYKEHKENLKQVR